jgi:hypothetical protein
VDKAATGSSSVFNRLAQQTFSTGLKRRQKAFSVMQDLVGNLDEKKVEQEERSVIRRVTS